MLRYRVTKLHDDGRLEDVEVAAVNRYEAARAADTCCGDAYTVNVEALTGLTAEDVCATWDMEDDKLRVELRTHIEREVFDDFRDLGYQWAPSRREFYGPWSTYKEDALLEIGAEIAVVAGSDDAESRIERFATFAAGARKRSAAAHQRSNEAVEWIPAGQPLISGRSKYHRKALERSRAAMTQALDEMKRAEYWEGRMNGALDRYHARRDPRLVFRRIYGLEAELRHARRELAEGQAAVKNGQPWGVYKARRWQRVAEHVEVQLTYQRSLFSRLGWSVEEFAASLRKGSKVIYLRHVCTVVRVNRRTVRLHVPGLGRDDTISVEISKLSPVPADVPTNGGSS